ncbi:MAG TPA: hypothetical protein VNL17_06610 [Verrucomicrobiae bacterium]|nr:hypothetical protein [Verrucomicrobiae bacterium]
MPNSFRHHALFHSNGTNQFLPEIAFSDEHAPAEGRQPIIAASRIVQFRCGPLVGPSISPASVSRLVAVKL